MSDRLSRFLRRLMGLSGLRRPARRASQKIADAISQAASGQRDVPGCGAELAHPLQRHVRQADEVGSGPLVKDALGVIREEARVAERQPRC